jgi:acyl-CoA reductase-like NAD-dependent aldehyde dehydrogenase
MDETVPENPGYIVDGERRHDGEAISVENPATETEIATVPEAGADGVDAAIAAASAVADEWGSDSTARSRLLRAIAAEIRDHAERIGRIETAETGRPVSDSIQQARSAAAYFEYYAGLADKVEGRQIPIPGAPERLDYTLREPYGVTAHIVPWNASVVLAARSFAPALAAGNTVVAKAPTMLPIVPRAYTWPEAAPSPSFPDSSAA